MKKRILLAVLALVMVSGCSNGTETSVTESSVPESVVSVAESAESSEKESSVESKAESKPESKAESKAESKPESKAESKVESKPESKAESKVESKPESKAESKAESKPESKVESKVESKPESKVESKAESKVESKVESKPESKVESSKEESTVIPATNKELVGFYNLTEMTGEGDSVISMKRYNIAGMYITLEINAGGTGVFSEYKEKANITWNDKYINLTHYDDMEYSVSGDRLALYSDDMTLVFERTDKEELKKKMEENSESEELSGEIDPDAVGDYILKEMDMEDEFDFDEDVYLTLHNDGTGYLESEGEQLEITWVDGQIKAMDDIFYYEKEGNDIVVDFYGIYVKFEKV